MRAQRGDNREGTDVAGVELRPGRAIGVSVGEGPIFQVIAPDRPLPVSTESRFQVGGDERGTVHVSVYVSEVLPGEPVPNPLPWRRVGELVLVGGSTRKGDVLLVDVLLFPDVVDVRVEDERAGVAIEERFDL